MNNDMSWGAPFVTAPAPMPDEGMSLDHMEKHVREWTALSQRSGYHTGLSTQVHMLLLKEPLHKMLKLLDRMRAQRQVSLYYCGPTRALWSIPGISLLGFTSFGSLDAFSWEAARTEAIRQATIWPDMASNGISAATKEHMEYTLNQLQITKRATHQMTDATCIYCG